MKKEKIVRTYQRRTKTGKVVTVKQHTAKYDAVEMLKEAAKKKGAGDELEALKKKPQINPAMDVEPKDDALGFTADEFKQWYHWDTESDPKNKAAKKVEKALKEKLGAKGYKKYYDEMTDSYSARGHNKAFKEISLNTDDPRETAAKMAKYESKPSKSKGFDNEKSFSQNFPKELRQYIDSRNFSLKKKPTKSVERAFNDAGFEIHRNDVEGIWEPTRNGMRYKETDWSAKNKAERAEKSDVVKWAKANGYSLRKDGMFQLKADSKKSRHEIYTLKDLEAKMGTDKKSSTKKTDKTKTDKLPEKNEASAIRQYAKDEDIPLKSAYTEWKNMSPTEKAQIKRNQAAWDSKQQKQKERRMQVSGSGKSVKSGISKGKVFYGDEAINAKKTLLGEGYKQKRITYEITRNLPGSGKQTWKTTVTALVSPDGKRAYKYEGSGNTAYLTGSDKDFNAAWSQQNKLKADKTKKEGTPTRKSIKSNITNGDSKKVETPATRMGGGGPKTFAKAKNTLKAKGYKSYNISGQTVYFKGDPQTGKGFFVALFKNGHMEGSIAPELRKHWKDAIIKRSQSKSAKKTNSSDVGKD